MLYDADAADYATPCCRQPLPLRYDVAAAADAAISLLR